MGEGKLKGLWAGLRTGNVVVGVHNISLSRRDKDHISLSAPSQVKTGRCHLIGTDHWGQGEGSGQGFRWVSHPQGLRES